MWAPSGLKIARTELVCPVSVVIRLHANAEQLNRGASMAAGKLDAHGEHTYHTFIRCQIEAMITTLMF